jgi:uracil-DNA glycosylase
MEKVKMHGVKLFKDVMAVKARLEQLREPHIKPLSAFVEALRLEDDSRRIPYFDPKDGGINAECLFLLEAPGGKAVEFISRNNNDETAKNFFELNCEAGIPRERTISWNIVPWYIGTEDEKKIHAATVKDISDGTPHLLRLLKLLPKLRAVVFVGKKAQRVKEDVRRNTSGLEFFDSPHPSPLFVNRPGNRDILLNKLIEVSHFINITRM